jgi:nitric oxide reductase NorQ protein
VSTSARPHRFVETDSELERIRRYVERGEPVLLLGPTGCGKTTLLSAIADALGRPLVPVTGGPSLTDADLLGGYLFAHDAMTWHDGPLVYAVRRGLPFFLDEIGKTSEGTLRPLYPLLDDRRELHLVGKLGEAPEIVRAAPGFSFVGAYTQRELGSLPEAFLQRCRVVRLSYLEREAEARLLVDREGIGEADAQYLVEIANVMRAGAEERRWRAPSTRSVLLAARAVKDGVPRRWVVRESLLGPLELGERDLQGLVSTLEAKGLSFEPAEPLPSAEVDPGDAIESFESTGNESAPDG